MWQKILGFFWITYLNIIIWKLFWMLTSLVIWNLNTTLSTTLKYCYKKAINKKLKLMGGAMKYFPKRLLGHEIFRSMVSWVTKFFWKTCKTLRPPLLHKCTVPRWLIFWSYIFESLSFWVCTDFWITLAMRL